MTYVKLRRHAPEASTSTTCSLCGTTDTASVTDHVLVGSPGTPKLDAGLCSACGAVLALTAQQFGNDLALSVEEAQTQAGPAEITIPRSQSHTEQSGPCGEHPDKEGGLH